MTSATETRYPSLTAFYAARGDSQGAERILGQHWRNVDGGSYTLAVTHARGDVYVLDNFARGVELLTTLCPPDEPHCAGGEHGAHCPYQIAEHRVLHGWAGAIRLPWGLRWVRMRVADYLADAACDCGHALCPRCGAPQDTSFREWRP